MTTHKDTRISSTYLSLFKWVSYLTGNKIHIQVMTVEPKGVVDGLQLSEKEQCTRTQTASTWIDLKTFWQDITNQVSRHV